MAGKRPNLLTYISGPAFSRMSQSTYLHFWTCLRGGHVQQRLLVECVSQPVAEDGVELAVAIHVLGLVTHQRAEHVQAFQPAPDSVARLGYPLADVSGA